MAERYRSGALAAAHETARGLTEAGAMAKRTMKAFDEMCLTPVEEMTPEKIRASDAGECEPGGVRPLSQCDCGSGEPVGTGREAPARRVAEASDAGREERSRGRRLMPEPVSGAPRPGCGRAR